MTMTSRKKALSAATDTVAAADLFGTLLEVGKLAGMPHRQALRSANAAALRKTGIDVLAELEALDMVCEAEIPAADDSPSITRFLAEWLAGKTPYPYAPCGSVDLHRAYVAWCRERGLAVLSAPAFIAKATRQGCTTKRSVRYFANSDYTGGVRGAMMFIPVDARKPSDQTQTQWLTDCWHSFRNAIDSAELSKTSRGGTKGGGGRTKQNLRRA